MKLWVDDMRLAPNGYRWARSVYEAKICCCQLIKPNKILQIEEINLDHDSGKYHYLGGDYIELLKWLENKQRLENWIIKTKFHIHSMNVVGVQNMRAIIERNGWEEIF